MPLQCTRRDEVEYIRRAFIHGEFRTNATVLGQKMRQRYTALLFWNSIGENGIKPSASARTRHDTFRKGRHILQPDTACDRFALFTNKREIVGTTEAPFFLDLAILRWRGMVFVGEHIVNIELGG